MRTASAASRPRWATSASTRTMTAISWPCGTKRPLTPRTGRTEEAPRSTSWFSRRMRRPAQLEAGTSIKIDGIDYNVGDLYGDGTEMVEGDNIVAECPQGRRQGGRPDQGPDRRERAMRLLAARPTSADSVPGQVASRSTHSSTRSSVTEDPSDDDRSDTVYLTTSRSFPAPSAALPPTAPDPLTAGRSNEPWSRRSTRSSRH